MDSDARPQHIPAAELLEYFEHRLPEERQTEIEEHLADCDACTALARRTCRFAHIWHRWTARAHLEAHRRAAKAKPLGRGND